MVAKVDKRIDHFSLHFPFFLLPFPTFPPFPH